MRASENKTIGEAFRENQDAVITTMVLLATKGAAIEAEGCGCFRCSPKVMACVSAASLLRKDLIELAELTPDAIEQLEQGAVRRIVKGVPS
jgi:hypothetical protein